MRNSGVSSRNLKVADSIVAKYEEASRLLDDDNATKGACYIKTATTQEIHAMSNHHSKITQDNNDKFIKSCRNCGKGQKVKQCPAKDKLCNKCNKIGHFAINADLLKVFFNVHRSINCRESHLQNCTKVPNQPCPGIDSFT